MTGTARTDPTSQADGGEIGGEAFFWANPFDNVGKNYEEGELLQVPMNYFRLLSKAHSASLEEQCKILGIHLENRRTFKDQLGPESAASLILKRDGWALLDEEGWVIKALARLLCNYMLSKDSGIADKTRLGGRIPNFTMNRIRRHSRFSRVIANKFEVVRELSNLDMVGVVQERRAQSEKSNPYFEELPIEKIDQMTEFIQQVGKEAAVAFASLVVCDEELDSGWPDLTLVKNRTIRFCEVKVKDKLSTSQMYVIRKLLEVGGAEVSVLHLDRYSSPKSQSTRPIAPETQPLE